MIEIEIDRMNGIFQDFHVRQILKNPLHPVCCFLSGSGKLFDCFAYYQRSRAFSASDTGIGQQAFRTYPITRYVQAFDARNFRAGSADVAALCGGRQSIRDRHRRQKTLLSHQLAPARLH